MWMRRYSFKKICTLAAFAAIFAPFHAFAADEVDPCPAGNLVICNLQIPMPGNPVGFKAIMTVPAPYVHDPFTVECGGSSNGSFGYIISDTSKVTCTLAI